MSEIEFTLLVFVIWHRILWYVMTWVAGLQLAQFLHPALVFEQSTVACLNYPCTG
jgi:hypothetical protein